MRELSDSISTVSFDMWIEFSVHYYLGTFQNSVHMATRDKPLKTLGWGLVKESGYQDEKATDYIVQRFVTSRHLNRSLKVRAF